MVARRPRVVARTPRVDSHLLPGGVYRSGTRAFVNYADKTVHERVTSYHVCDGAGTHSHTVDVSGRAGLRGKRTGAGLPASKTQKENSGQQGHT
jgi:hypothetical protein